MKKICILTSTRADFGILSPLLSLLQKNKSVELFLIASGTHLSPEYGRTINEIEKAKIKIHKKSEILLSSDSDVGVAKSFALGSLSFTETLSEIRPDVSILLGDRYEMLAFATSCLLLSIPMIHIHGGELTLGAIDDSIRHAITKMSHLHFATTEKYRQRIIQLGEEPSRVFNVGSMGVENINKVDLLSRKEIEKKLKIKLTDQIFLITLHPETLSKGEAESHVKNLIKGLSPFKEATLIFTRPNADEGGSIIVEEIQDFCTKRKNAFLFDSLGSQLYYSLIQISDAVIGNSSSGLIEVPSFKKPTVNIGIRQLGREAGPTVIHVPFDPKSIEKGIRKAISKEFLKKIATSKNPYEKSNSAKQILDVILKTNFDKILKKHFQDLPGKEISK